MKKFMGKNFLLKTKTAEKLYEHGKGLPIVDYHCHLIPSEIAENKRFTNITDLALRGDHYKWRLMRASGVKEKYITGNGSDEDKFAEWCGTLEDCIGSPLYHWTHLEMRRYFDYDGPITKELSAKIYKHCNKIIAGQDFSAWNIFKKFNVAMIGTTDDPVDDLKYHKEMAGHRQKDKALPRVLPTFRPSKAMNIEAHDFKDYIKTLSEASGVKIEGWEDLQEALSARMDFFKQMGCLSSDNTLEPPAYAEGTQMEADVVLRMALKGESLSPSDIEQYKTALMLWLGKAYHKRGWVMQIHMNAQRNNNTKMFKRLGPDTGYDSISDDAFSRPLGRILDGLESENALPKTVLYALNPVSDTMLATMIGNFQGGGVKGKMQWGCPWWFNDTKRGIYNHLTILADCGVLAAFIGMLTDSRSFMSYPRHEYFRRILANTLAEWVENGEFPNDLKRLNRIMENICSNNVMEYFELKN